MVYIQPTFCYSDNLVRIGIATRLSGLDFSNGRINNFIPEGDLLAIKQIEMDNPFYLMESGVNVGVRLDPVTISGNIVVGQLLGASNYDTYKFDPINISVGASLDLHYFYQKKKDKNIKNTPDPNAPK